MEFSLTTVGETDTLSIAISNVGATSLSISNIWADNNVFSVSPTQGDIAASDSLLVQIIFTPQAGVWYSANLNINNSDPDNNIVIINLAGGGVLSGVPVISVPITTSAFGDIAINDTGVVEIPVFNIGNETLTISNVTSSLGLFIPQVTSLTIPMNSSTTIPVYFIPETTGWRSASLTIFHDGSNGTETSVSINGFGYVGHFDPINPTGEQYQIVVSSIIDSSGYGLDEGDEIGLFDGLECVGVGVYHGSNSLNISAWKAIPDQSLPGYSDGNLIQFKYFLKDGTGSEHVLDAIPTFVIGNGSYGFGVYSEVSLKVLDLVTPFEPYDGPVFYISTSTGRNYLNNGSVDQPFATIQHGINVVQDSDTILVAPGMYLENINFNGKNIVIGSLFLTTEINSYVSQTIIDGSQSGSVVTISSGENLSAMLNGFTIQNGRALNGGGIVCIGTNPIIKNSIITDNVSTKDGGGIFCWDNANPVLDNLTIINNQAGWSGSGLYSYNSSPILSNITIIGNSSNLDGGGIYCSLSNPILNNVLIAKNTARLGGGIRAETNSVPELVNVTFYSNKARDDGGGIFCSGNSNPHLVNTIMWNDSLNNTEQEIFVETGSLDVTYSDIKGGWNGLGNINLTPQFIDIAENNFQLRNISPCVNVGNPTSDFSREPEPNGDRINMGAYGNTLEAAIAALTITEPDTSAIEDSLYSVDIAIPQDSTVIFTYELISAPAWISFNDTAAIISGIPNNTQVGNNQISIAASDNYGRTDTLVYNVAVENTPPLITTVADTIATEDQLYYYDIDSNDDGQGSIRYTALVLPVWITLDSLTGELSGIPGDSAVGDTSVSIQVSDGNGGNMVQSFNLRVVNRNDAIRIVSQPDTVAIEDSLYIYVVETLDDDLNDRALFSFIEAPVGMLIDSLSGRITWLPDNDNVGDTVVTFTVVDDSGATDTQSYMLHILNINDIPVISSVADTIAIEDQTYTYAVIAYDVDVGDHISYALTSAPAGMTITDSTGFLSWLPDNNDVGDTIVTIVVTDDSGAVAIQSYELDIENVNDPPVIVSALADFTVDEDAPDTSFALFDVFTDDDIVSVNDSLIFSVENDSPELVNAHIIQDTLFIDFLEDQNGIVNISVTAKDQEFVEATESFIVTINSINDIPSSFSLLTLNGTVFADSVISFSWQSSSDPDIGTNNDQLYYTFRYSNLSDFNIYTDVEDLTDTTVSMNVMLQQDQLYYWKVRVEDSFREKVWSNETFTFSLNYSNNPPSTPILLVTTESIIDTNTIIKWISSNDSDLGDTVRYELQISTDNGFTDTLLTYTTVDTSVVVVDLAYTDLVEDGLYWLRVQALDNQGLTSGWSQLVAFYFDNVNTAPQASSGLVSPVAEVVTTLQPILIWHSGSDIDPGDAVVSLGYEGAVWSQVDTVAFSTMTGDTDYVLISDITENEYYQWTVRTLDDGGLISSWSDTTSFWVNSVNEAPGAFGLIEPESDTLFTSYPTFSWHPALDPDVGSVLTYSLRYGTDPGFNTYSEVENITDTTHTLADSLWDDVAYYWRAKVSDEFGLSTWSSDTLIFIVNAVNVAPTVPELTGLQDYTVLDTSQVIGWSSSQDLDVGDVVSYELQVSTDSAFTDTLLTYTTADTSVGVVDLAYIDLVENGLHWLRLQALDNHGQASSWSQLIAFYYDNVNTPPQPSSGLVSPVAEVVTTLRPILIWGTGSDIDPGDGVTSLGYEGAVWSQVDTVAFSTTAGDTDYVLISDLTENEYYQWAVRTIDDGGLISGWSDTVSFWVNSVNEAPGAFSLIEPENADTVSSYTPTCIWESSVDPDPFDSITYMFRYSLAANFNQYSDEMVQTDTTFTFSDSLNEDSWLYWRVNASDPYNLNYWSPIFSFYVNVIPNIPPIAVWTFVDTIISGLTQIPYVTEDPDSENVYVTIEYSVDSGNTWELPTVYNSRRGYTLRDQLIFTWDTNTDLPEWYGTILLRVIPEDDEAIGMGDTLTLLIDNIPPDVSLNSIPIEQSGVLEFNYLATNDLFSPTNINLYYRITPTVKGLLKMYQFRS